MFQFLRAFSAHLPHTARGRSTVAGVSAGLLAAALLVSASSADCH